MLSSDELRALAALAEAATPGPWEAVRDEEGLVGIIRIGPPRNFVIGVEGGGVNGDGVIRPHMSKATEKYIAAASSDVVRELVAELLAARSMLLNLGVVLAAPAQGENIEAGDPVFIDANGLVRKKT